MIRILPLLLPLVCAAATACAQQAPAAPLCVPSSAAAPAASAQAAETAAVTMRFDYAGAEAILDAIERDSLSDADVDALLRIHGVRAMVDNVTRFVPEAGVPEFRREIRTFARNKRGGEHAGVFQLSDAWRERPNVRALLDAVRANEACIVRESLARLDPYRPDTGPLQIGVYLVAGGVSDGFAFEHDIQSFYANLVRAEGDFNDLVFNAVHEAYHVLQMTAQQRSGTFVAWITDDRVPPVERLLAGTLLEGTANFVADPTRSTAAGPRVDRARARYAANAQPDRIAENFALFDRIVRQLRANGITWRQVNDRGFAGDARFYFVGYEMAKAIERYCGSGCIGELFSQRPVEFFRRYVALYREHPEIPGRFSRETEEYLASLP